MNRDEMKNAAYAELTEQGYLPTSKTDRMAVVDIVADAVEPLIRADERAKPCMDARRLRGLRAKVEALTDGGPTITPFGVGYDSAIHDVLALLDGATS